MSSAIRFSLVFPALLLLLVGPLAGCRRSSDTNGEPVDTAEAPAEPEAPDGPETPAEPEPEDDPDVLAAIAETEGVQVRREGGYVVELDLRGLRGEAAEDQTDEFAWAAGLPRLSVLRATGPGVTDEAVAELAGHPSLSVLHFDRRSQVGDAGIEAIKDLPRLTDIALERSAITDESLAHLAESDTILRIRAARTKLTDEGVRHLENAPQLELLDLLECTGISDDSAETFGKLKRLRNLRLYGGEITDASMPQIGSLPNLVALGLQYARVGDEGLKELESLSQLRELNLYGTTVTDAGIPSLAKLTRLEKLRLRETGIRGEANVESWSELTELRELDLSESPTRDPALEAIGQLPNIESLNLWNTEVTDTGAAYLADAKTLKVLNFDNLWDITDAALEPVGQLENLELLHLGGTSITDEGLPHLYGLENLRTLFLTRTGVSRDAYEELQEEMPWVETIEY